MLSTSIEYLLQELCINHHLLHKNYIIIVSVKQFAGLFRQILHITYLARKIATKAIESVEASYFDHMNDDTQKSTAFLTNVTRLSPPEERA